MGLKERKKLSNGLYKYDDGKNYWQDMGNPLGDGWNQWTKSPSANVIGDPTLENQSLLTGRNGISPYSPTAIIQPLQQQAMDPSSIENQYRIANIQGPKNIPPKSNSATGLKAASVIGGTANIVGGYIAQQSAVKSSDELLANAGTSQGNVMGVGYQQQNDINAGREMDAIEKSGISNTLGSVATGASAGAAFGPIGAAIGGFVGGVAGLIGLGTSKHKLRKRIENARLMAQRRNTYNMSGAMTTGLQQDYYTNNASGGLLYANKGKDIW